MILVLGTRVMNAIETEILSETSKTVDNMLDRFSTYLLKAMRDKFEHDFTRWVPSDTLLEKYPFLQNKKQFVDDFFSCLSLQVVEAPDGKEILLNADLDKMKTLTFPDTLFESLEYGSSSFPVLSFLQTALSEAEITLDALSAQGFA